MASLQPRNSLDDRSSDEKTRSRDEEKDALDATVTVSSADSGDEDEALKLVGKERAAQFSEEFNRKLRNKLVRRETLPSVRYVDLEPLCVQDRQIIPLCAAVYFTQFL